ncbi:MAG: hypothetical protein AAGM38_06080 [Pseudomonadota bacterium]
MKKLIATSMIAAMAVSGVALNASYARDSNTDIDMCLAEDVKTRNKRVQCLQFIATEISSLRSEVDQIHEIVRSNQVELGHVDREHTQILDILRGAN